MSTYLWKNGMQTRLKRAQYENPDDFQSDLKAVCRFIQNSDDNQKLERMLEEHHEEFETMEEDTYDLIGALGNMKQLKMVKEKSKTEDGEYNMCKGMADWLKKREAEGERNKLREIVKKKLDKGMKVEEIAEFLEEDIETIRELADSL